MKKLVFLFSLLIAVAVLMNSCNKEKKSSKENEEKSSIVKEKPSVKPESISLEEFFKSAVSTVEAEPVKFEIPKHVKVPAKTAVISPFKREWLVVQIDPILKKYPLTVVQKFEDGSQNLIYTYEQLEFQDDDEVLTVLDPAPEYIAVVKGEVYLIKASGELWKKRK